MSVVPTQPNCLHKMTRRRLQAPSRIHFGLLAWNPQSARQFGGAGLMIERPGLELSAQPSAIWQAEGPLARRTLQLAERISEKLAKTGPAPPPLRFKINRAAPEHVGLGTGTQLGLSVARVLTEMVGQTDAPVSLLAELADRGVRSGIGLHGFERGGLIVDGGRRSEGAIGLPPLLATLEFPSDWSVLVVLPATEPGLHGSNEVQAFAQLPPIPDALTDRLCRLVLLGLLPAVVERDLTTFGAALTELQHLVGECFAPAQGGRFVRPELESIVKFLVAEGVRGVGQSSWGPALYGFSEEPPERRTRILERLSETFRLPAEAAFWTQASANGAIMLRETSPHP
jgi:beta-ribofuranosylaminobenzene 5'-phosphate synthase